MGIERIARKPTARLAIAVGRASCAVNLDWAWIQRNPAMIGNLLVDHIILSRAARPHCLFVISLPLGYLVFKTKRCRQRHPGLFLA